MSISTTLPPVQIDGFDTLQFHESVAAFREGISEHLEMMAAAFLKATDIPPEECHLVVQAFPEKNTMVYYFERRNLGENEYATK